MFFRTRFSASATTAFSAIVIARNTWPAAENYWLCSRPSHNRLATTGTAASNSLGSIRSSAPNAKLARWYASPPFPLSGSPQSLIPHEPRTHTPMFDRQSPTGTHPSASVCLSLGRSASQGHFQPFPPGHFDSPKRTIRPVSRQFHPPARTLGGYQHHHPPRQPFKTHSLRECAAA